MEVDNESTTDTGQDRVKQRGKSPGGYNSPSESFHRMCTVSLTPTWKLIMKVQQIQRQTEGDVLESHTK